MDFHAANLMGLGLWFELQGKDGCAGTMLRRRVIALTGAIAFARSAAAQSSRRARMGYLSGGRPDENKENTLDTLLSALRQLGWSAGDNLIVDERWAHGDSSIFDRLTSELIALKPDILVSTGATETRALIRATEAIPIVFCQVSGDPVAIGLVHSIARPGGNVTGFMQAPQILWGKRIELLTAFMGAPPRRLAWIGNPLNFASELSWEDARKSAAEIGAEISRHPVDSANAIEGTFASIKDRDALLVQYDYLLSTERRRVASLVAKLGIPAVYENRIQVLAGGLMSYGGDLRENYRQAAGYVDRLLKGATPANFPVVQASRFEFVLNVAVARALGREMPPFLLARADELVE